MKKHFTDSSSEIISIIIAVLITGMVCSSIYESRRSDLVAQIDYLEEENEQQREEINELYRNIEDWASDYGSLEESYADIKKSLDSYRHQYAFVVSGSEDYHDYKDCSWLNTNMIKDDIIVVEKPYCLSHHYSECMVCKNRRIAEEEEKDKSHVTITKIVEDENTEALRKLKEKYPIE